MQPEIPDNNPDPIISAVILAAGASRRMGEAKLLLPWGDTTVVGRVVEVILSCGITSPVIVTGRAVEEVRARLGSQPLHWVHNPDYATTEMLRSLQLGIPALPVEAAAFLIVLGDMPQIEKDIIEKIITVYLQNRPALVIPSFLHRRGHPWLVARSLWPELLSMPASTSLRHFLNDHSADIQYIETNHPSVLQDLDTPEDYARMKPVS